MFGRTGVWAHFICLQFLGVAYLSWHCYLASFSGLIKQQNTLLKSSSLYYLLCYCDAAFEILSLNGKPNVLLKTLFFFSFLAQHGGSTWRTLASHCVHAMHSRWKLALAAPPREGIESGHLLFKLSSQQSNWGLSTRHCRQMKKY